MTLKKLHRPATFEPAHLSIRELLAEHERVFGPLTPEAKRRLQRAADTARGERWERPDSLAA